MTDLKQSFKLYNSDQKITFTCFEDRLLFIHSDFTSSQFRLDDFGINLMPQSKCIQFQMWFTSGENYLSLFFDNSEHEPLAQFFRKLGYPCHNTIRL